MINAEYIITEKFGKFIPTDISGTEVLILISIVVILVYTMHKLLSDSKYENSIVVKLIDKIF